MRRKRRASQIYLNTTWAADFASVTVVSDYLFHRMVLLSFAFRVYERWNLGSYLLASLTASH